MLQNKTSMLQSNKSMLQSNTSMLQNNTQMQQKTHRYFRTTHSKYNDATRSISSCRGKTSYPVRSSKTHKEGSYFASRLETNIVWHPDTIYNLSHKIGKQSWKICHDDSGKKSAS